MNSSQKVAFITGANRGIGLETARELGKLGIQVVLGVRDPEKSAPVLETLRAEKILAEMIRFDATDPQTFEAVRGFLEEKFGRLDILVNNAGISLEKLGGGGTASTVSPQTLRETFEVNFFAVIELTQKLLPLLAEAPAGRIVNVSSVLGSLTLHSDPSSYIADVKMLAYDASKTALNAFTVHLANELHGTKIKVNSGHPGWVKTELGGPDAPLEVSEGSKTSVQLAILDEEGPTGGYFHLGKTLPW